MGRKLRLEPPFFEIGPKNYMYGKDIVDLAKVADAAAKKYDVRVIYTTPYANIKEVAQNTRNIYVFAPHMDYAPIGKGLANILPESIKEAGAKGVMLNHSEKPLSLIALGQTIRRARGLELMTIVCADSVEELKGVSILQPDMIVAEPIELIGTGNAADTSYVTRSLDTVFSISKDIGVLIGGGISSGEDAYRVIKAGADATGSSSGIFKAGDPEKMIYEMLEAVRRAWDEREEKK